jgi:hypothetical protein
MTPDAAPARALLAARGLSHLATGVRPLASTSAASGRVTAPTSDVGLVRAVGALVAAAGAAMPTAARAAAT